MVATNQDVEAKNEWASFVATHPGNKRIRDDNGWALFALPSRRPFGVRCPGDPVRITAVSVNNEKVDATAFRDQNPATRWTSALGQRSGDSVTLNLGNVVPLCGMVVSMGTEAASFPRRLRVSTSLDKRMWQSRFLSDISGAAFLAALEKPDDARMFIPLGGSARFITLELERSQPQYPWAMADIAVYASPALLEATATRREPGATAGALPSVCVQSSAYVESASASGVASCVPAGRLERARPNHPDG